MTRPLVVFPDAAAVVATWLRDQLGVHTDNRVPNPRPQEWILVCRVGGPLRDIVTDQATLTIEAWSTSDEAAHDLAQIARAQVHHMTGHTIGDVVVGPVGEFAGPVQLPDPVSEQPRYTLTVTVALRGATPAGS